MNPLIAPRTGRTRPWAPLVLVALLAAGCLSATDEYASFDPHKAYVNPGVFPGVYGGGDGRSTVLVAGNLTAGPARVFQLQSSLPALPVAGDSASDATVYIRLAVWLPNVSTPVPVIVDAGPSFETGYHADPANASKAIPNSLDNETSSTSWLLRNFLPRGYGVVQLAVRGTGTSGGCFDLLGPSERHDIDQALTWIGQQPWSNGRIAMTGIFYDGATAWEAASTGNPYLKTIIPFEGTPDIFSLLFHNGTGLDRTTIAALLATFARTGLGTEFPHPIVAGAVRNETGLSIGAANGRQAYQDRQSLACRNAGVEGALNALASGATGGRTAFWQERDWRAEILRNYHGSVLLSHGLRDGFAEPHTDIPFNRALLAAGIEVKELYGQWGLGYPDSQCQKVTPLWIANPCRSDFAEIMLHWLEHHLAENASLPLGPRLQVANDFGYWRNADSFPPLDAEWRTLYLTADHGLRDAPSATTSMFTLMPADSNGPLNYVEVKSQPFAKNAWISGLPQLKLPFIPQAPDGFVAAQILDENPDGHVRALWQYQALVHQARPTTSVLAHAQMDLRYADGSETARLLVPGQRGVAQMEFEPLDTFIPAGDRLVLWLFQQPNPGHAAGAAPAPVKVELGGPDAQLRLPLVTVDPADVFPVPGQHFPDLSNLGRMYTYRPAMPQRLGDVPLPLCLRLMTGRADSCGP